MQTDPTIDEKVSRVARLMTRIRLGAEEGLPLFTIRIWVAQMARLTAELEAALDRVPQDDLFHMTMTVDSHLSEEDAEWFSAGLECHGKTGPIPDTIEQLTEED